MMGWLRRSVTDIDESKQVRNNPHKHFSKASQTTFKLNFMVLNYKITLPEIMSEMSNFGNF